MILCLANGLILLGKKTVFDSVLGKHWIFLSVQDLE